ncbi:MAG: hypothetical protein PHW24_01260 [Candidatus Moranbacteria bacterium]|nr:hypothetical protein [Candidatus Moranbacteria bacterium]
MEKFEYKESQETIKELLMDRVRNMIVDLVVLTRCSIGEIKCSDQDVQKVRDKMNEHVKDIEQSYSRLDDEKIVKLKKFLDAVKMPEHPNKDYIDATYEAYNEINKLIENL